MSTVVLIDYGSGNLRSAEKALVEASRRAGTGHAVVVTAEPDAVLAAERIMLPGVSAFASCMDALEARPGLIEAMDEAVHARGKPFLGACSGMQLLASRGWEFEARAGLGWIPGEVRRLEPADPHAKVPHMGWNEVSPRADHPLFAGLGEACSMYFTHSYAFHPEDDEAVIGTVDHGGLFTAAVARDNVAGVQFHPEKSQAVGLELIARFLLWRP